MSENPVRSASVKAAKKFKSVAGFINPKTDAGTLADLIESHLAPVVAAAEEAMKEKIRHEIKIIPWGGSRNHPTYSCDDIDDVFCAIPTGTALAEYCTVLEANDAELANLKAQVKALQSELFGSHNVCCNVRSHAVGAGQGCSCAAPMPKTELQELYRQVKALREALRDARFVIASRHRDELATKALLERIDAADAGESRKEGEK